VNKSIEEFFDDPEGNCQITLLSGLTAMGKRVSRRLRSREFFEDNEFTSPVTDLSYATHGDVVGLRYAHRVDPKFDHVGIILVKNGVLNLFHNPRHIGHAVIQPLEEARKFAGHEVLDWIKRVNEFDPNLVHHTFLNRHRLSDLVTPSVA
jgi:hypothetical protein